MSETQKKQAGHPDNVESAKINLKSCEIKNSDSKPSRQNNELKPHLPIEVIYIYSNSGQATKSNNEHANSTANSDDDDSEILRKVATQNIDKNSIKYADKSNETEKIEIIPFVQTGRDQFQLKSEDSCQRVPDPCQKPILKKVFQENNACLDFVSGNGSMLLTESNFFYVGPPKEDIFFDHLLCSI